MYTHLQAGMVLVDIFIHLPARKPSVFETVFNYCQCVQKYFVANFTNAKIKSEFLIWTMRIKITITEVKQMGSKQSNIYDI